MKPSLTWTQYSSLTYKYILYLRMTFFQSSPLFKRCTSLSGKGSSQDDGLCSVSSHEKNAIIWSKVPKLIAPGTISIDWLLYLFNSKTAPFWPWIYSYEILRTTSFSTSTSMIKWKIFEQFEFRAKLISTTLLLRRWAEQMLI